MYTQWDTSKKWPANTRATTENLFDAPTCLKPVWLLSKDRSREEGLTAFDHKDVHVFEGFWRAWEMWIASMREEPSGKSIPYLREAKVWWSLNNSDTGLNIAMYAVMIEESMLHSIFPQILSYMVLHRMQTKRPKEWAASQYFQQSEQPVDCILHFFIILCRGCVSPNLQFSTVSCPKYMFLLLNCTTIVFFKIFDFFCNFATNAVIYGHNYSNCLQCICPIFF